MHIKFYGKRRDVFQAIADPNRREILFLIADEPLNLNSIAENFEMTRPAVSQHVKILDENGLIVIRQKGRQRFVNNEKEGFTMTLNELGKLLSTINK